jgi:type II secretory pathway predicted ATPase ExeA
MLTLFGDQQAAATALAPVRRRRLAAVAPFGLSPDPRFMYRSNAYLWAFEQITTAVRQREGLVLVTGEAGTGKTLLCRTLLSRLSDRALVSVVLDPCVKIEELLGKILHDFGVLRGRNERRHTRHELVEMLHEFLASLIARNATAVIIIDEAQHLNQAMLEQLRLLSNCESDQAKLLQIVLVGTPVLDQLCRSPQMRHFDQRIARRCRLGPLRPGEVSDYIECRLTAAASEPTLLVDVDRGTVQLDAPDTVVANPFDRSGLEAIAGTSHGVPRIINLLAERSLEIAGRRGIMQIDARTVRAAARQLNIATPRRWFMKRRTVVVAAALLAVVAPATWLGASQLRWESAAGTGDRTARADVGSGGALAMTAGGSNPVVAETVDTLGVVDGFTIQAAALRRPDGAATIVQQLRGAGLPAFARTLPGGTWHLVLVGPYVTEGEVTAVQQALSRHGFADTKVVRDEGSALSQ